MIQSTLPRLFKRVTSFWPRPQARTRATDTITRRNRCARRRYAAASLAAVLLATTPGCEVFGILANALFPPKVYARYRLAKVPTLVLVDDPADQLFDAGLAGQIAEHIGFHLKQKRVIHKNHLTPPHLVDQMALSLGSEYARTPIDRIGTTLGAKQVIHVHIESMRLRDEPGLLRPRAVVAVKVIDATAGKRLYPPPETASGNNVDNGRVNVVMRYRSDAGDGVDSARGVRQKLAERIGRDVARLFFDYLPRQPGEPFEN